MNNLECRNYGIASLLKASAVIFIGLFLAACGDDNKNAGGTVEDQEVIAIADKTISGVSQKGPFVNGSSVTVQELDGETLAQTGNSYEGKIKNDMGEFSVKVTKLASQYALLKANGFYRNEVTGEKSKSQITLYALTDLSDRNEVNVNLLTHLEYERSLYLSADDSATVAAAKKQAEKEVLASFEITGDFANSEDLNIFGTDDGAAALLAVSILMQGDLSEADFTERLNDYATDIETDGMWGDTKTATKIADWASSKSLGGELENIRNNIAKWDISTDVPAFEKYVDNFWWQNYGLGSCEKKRNGEILQNTNKQSETYKTYFICNNNAWRLATVLEYDTYKWIDPTRRDTTKDAAVRYGDVIKTNCYVFENEKWRSGNENDCSLNLRGCTALRQDTVGKGSDKVYHICDAKSWRDATTYEKDTFGWKDSTDGAIKKGNVTDSIYVFDKTAWRATNNVESKLGGCVNAIADSVGKVGSTYFICKSNKWVDASAIEYDTYRWDAGKDGDSKLGTVETKNCYVYEDKVWRSGNETDCSLELRGCTALRQDTVGKGKDKVWHICDAKSWRAATTYEKDTFGWKDSTDGAIKKGNVTDSIYVFDKTAWRATNDVEAKLGGCVSAIADSVGKVGSTYYICKSNKWVEASAIEYDTYRWDAGKDGDSKSGSVNAKNCYVFEDKAWRSGNASDCSLGLRGCTVLRQDTVGKGKDDAWYKCVSQTWRTAADIEKDTATWGAGKDGEVRAGQVNKTVYYIYEISKKAWRNATILEKDTYDHKNNKDWEDGVDGEIKKGSVTDTIYVFDEIVWRTADDIEKVLGGCVAAIQDSVGKAGNTYYICNPRKWVAATAVQYNTYKQKCSEDGKYFFGNVNTSTKYVCDNAVFRALNAVELEADSACTSYNLDEYYILPKYDGKNNYSYYKCTENGWTFTTEKLNQGTMIDERDSHEYKTIGIKSQIWMAENLNYADSTNYPSMLGRNWCMDDPDSCALFGRYYTWSAAIDSVYWAKQGRICGDTEDPCGLPEKVKGICVDGWHVPNKSEWNTLYFAVENNSKSLQAMGFREWEKATDQFGYSAFPSGYYDRGYYSNIGYMAYFWIASEDDYGNSASWDLGSTAALGYTWKAYGFSVRCVKDEE